MTCTLTAEALAEIEARASAATPGPWEQTDGNIWIDTRECVCCGRGSHYGCCGEPDVIGGQELIGTSNPVDAELMAHARTDIPALLAHIKAQAAEIERLTKERDEWKASCIGHGDKASAAEARATTAEAMVGALTKALSADGLKRSIDEMRPFTGKRGSIRIGTDEAHLIVALYDAALGAKP